MPHSVRQEASQEAQRLFALQPLFLDTETTGTSPNAEIVEIGIVNYDGKELFSSLVRPKGAMEPGAARLHGITPGELQVAPEWIDVWSHVETTLRGHWIGTYNSEFDLRMLRQTNQRSWIKGGVDQARFFCIMKLYARFQGDWDRRRGSYRWHSLESAAVQCQINLPNAHRATEDALLARALLIYMAEQI